MISFEKAAMEIDELERLFPQAVKWVKLQEKLIRRRGVPLSGGQMADALRLGVKYPERIRILAITAVPFPNDPRLQQAIVDTGLLGNTTKAALFGYGIWLHPDYLENRFLLVSELALLARCERMGGIEPFLRVYLTQRLSCLAGLCPMERDAHQAADQICLA